MDLIVNTVEHTKQISTKLVQKNCNVSNVCKNIEEGTKLREYKTSKRLKKTIRKNPLFVEPEEKSTGLKWKSAKICLYFENVEISFRKQRFL